MWGECVAGRGCKVQDWTNRSELKVTDLFNAGKTSGKNSWPTREGAADNIYTEEMRQSGHTWETQLNRIWQDRGSKTEHHTHRQETFKIKQEITHIEPQTETLELDLGAVSQYKSVLVFLLFRTSQVHAGVRTSRDGRTQHMSVLECIWWHRNSVVLLLLTALTTNVINICYGNCR